MVEEYKFKIPKAKDLPPSWFELVLRPECFQKHLKILHNDAHAEPSALVLLTTFLEKAGCIEGQTPNEGSYVSEDRKQTFVDCALFLAAFLKWDLTMLENGLPSAITYSLLLSLKEKFPRQASPSSSSSFTEESQLTIMAHVLYCWWIVRVFAHGCLPVHPPQGLLWEGSCASHDKIKQLIQPHLDEAVNLLSTVVRDYCHNIFPLPCVELCLPLAAGGGSDAAIFCVTLPHDVISVDKNVMFAQLTFDLGRILFNQELYSQAHEFFARTSSLLDTLSFFPFPPSIGKSTLDGYLAACSSMLGVAEKEEVKETNSAVAEVEKLRKISMKDLPDVLLSSSLQYSNAYKAGIERQAVAVIKEDEVEKMEVEVNSEKQLSLSIKLSVWSIVQSVMEGSTAGGGIGQLLFNNDPITANMTFEYFLKVVVQVVKKERDEAKQRFAVFLKSVCSYNRDWRMKAIEAGLDQLLLDSSLLPIVPRPLISTEKTMLSSSSSSNSLQQVLSSDNSTQLMDRVTSLFQQIPASEHATLAAKWQGGKSWFASSDQVSDPLLQTQYNALLHKAAICTQSKNYSSAVTFCSAALKLISSSITSSSRNKLLTVLGEHVLELSMQSTGMGLGKLTHDEAVEKHSSLIEDVKRYYSRPQAAGSSASTFTMAAVFLLNLQQYSCMEKQPNQPEQVCPRLATAALCVKENRDTRKCTRDLFEAVSSIFITPPNGGEGRALHRKSLEFISTNLQDEISLCYLLCALTRLWTILTKPEYEVSIELGTHWPTAVGNASTINTSYVLRVLDSALNHALVLKPKRVEWLVLRADLRGAVGSYGAALMSYLEAGALESDFFETVVPESVWSQQVLRKMINCCCKLEYHTHAVILCQLLSPIDYSFTFSLLKEHIQDMLNSMFIHLWDMTIIEYLIYTVAKQRDSIKQTAAVQVAGQPELNTSNSRDVLQRAVEVRRRRFLRLLFRTVSVAVQ